MNIIAFGRNTVVNIVRSDFFELKKVIISVDKKDDYKLLYQEIASKNILCQILTKENFSRYIPDKKHQGIIAFIKNYNYSPLSSLLRRKTSAPSPVLVMLDGIEDPHNFGAILRTCAAFGINGVIISNKNQVAVNSTVVKVSTGGVSCVPVCMVNSLKETINILKNSSFKIACTVCSEEGKVIDYRNFPPQKAVCIVFGSEHNGIRKGIVEKADFLLTIPMKNAMNSLNISVSCGVILSALSYPRKSTFLVNENRVGKYKVAP